MPVNLLPWPARLLALEPRPSCLECSHPTTFILKPAIPRVVQINQHELVLEVRESAGILPVMASTRARFRISKHKL